MRRYRGADKPPGPTLSPPPYSRNSSSRSNAGSTRQSTGMNMPRLALSSVSSPKAENELSMVRGLVSSSVPFLDPRTKKPMIPPAGRTIPKLKMADLASSLGPLVERQMEKTNNKSKPALLAVSDKRVADAMKEVTGTKDMLESFDDAVKLPDLRAINSKVLQLRKVAGPPSSRLGNAHPSKTKTVSSGKFNIAKVSPKNEEQNIRKLMDQLKDKYLDDMESQLGLAIERRPKPFFQGENRDGIYDQISGRDSVVEVEIPKPSTNASEITHRIDKVVREWATESQKINSTMKVPVSAKQPQHSIGSMNRMNNTAWQKTAKSINDVQSAGKDKRKSNDDTDSNAALGRNKNLAKISSAFRKSLDPISKRDVRELIGFPEDDHVEKLDQEHVERRRAHESVFKNATISNFTSSPQDVNGNNVNKKSERNMAVVDAGGNSESLFKDPNRRKPNQISSRQNPFAKSLVHGDEHVVYNIIKEHMEYENSGGAPKLTQPSSRKPPTTRNATSVLRSDAAGKALLKYSDSHKKLQSVVNSFTDKVDVSAKKWPGPAAATRATGSSASEEESDISGRKDKLPLKLPVASVSSVATINSRRRNSSEVSTTLSRSMKTIDRASSVAQRLGTLMSRVALRNEAYDYEQEQKEKEAQQKAISLSTANANSSTALAQNSIRVQSVPYQYENPTRQNPYEIPQLLTNNSRDEIGRANVSPGVSKLDSSRFGKYVDEMKKVAEKAAASFEKFKERQEKNDNDLVSFSEDEEEASDYSDQGNGEASAIAAAAAEISAIQEEERKRKAQLQQRSLQQKKYVHSPRKQTNQSDAGTGTSPRETVELFSQINRSTDSDILNNNNKANTDPAQFKFIPDMSYTDQLMLQKLRNLKEKEGWTKAALSQQLEAANETMVGDVPNQGEIESIIKRATDLNLPREAERASMGPISLNAILRSRLSGNSKK